LPPDGVEIKIEKPQVSATAAEAHALQEMKSAGLQEQAGGKP
jgi:hypothetical protein